MRYDSAGSEPVWYGHEVQPYQLRVDLKLYHVSTIASMTLSSYFVTKEYQYLQLTYSSR